MKISMFLGIKDDDLAGDFVRRYASNTNIIVKTWYLSQGVITIEFGFPDDQQDGNAPASE